MSPEWLEKRIPQNTIELLFMTHWTFPVKMKELFMELTNKQRKYLSLELIEPHWKYNGPLIQNKLEKIIVNAGTG